MKRARKSKLILGSASPRRRELLSNIYSLKIIAPRIDETVKPRELPSAYIRRMAKEKWEAVGKKCSAGVLLTADTTVVYAGKIYGKARSAQEAKQMLRKFSNRKHWVMTAIAVGRCDLSSNQLKAKLIKTKIRFRNLLEKEIDRYLGSGEWRGKAGAYAIQGLAGGFVDRIEGSYTNVIGLPLKESLELIEKLRSQA